MRKSSLQEAILKKVREASTDKTGETVHKATIHRSHRCLRESPSCTVTHFKHIHYTQMISV